MAYEISYQKVELAIVVLFHRNKFYGFAEVEGTKEVIFFHLNDCLNVAVTERDGIVWGDQAIDRPFEGDKILFERAWGKEGKPKAKPWTYLLWVDAVHEAHLNKRCDLCPHKLLEHNNGECIFCGCGHEGSDHEDDLNTTPTWSTGLGGHEGYE